MNVACGHYMVKIVLIGKNRGAHGPHAANRARFVALEFILNEPRGIMVNRALPARASVFAIIGDQRGMNPILNRLG